MKLHYLNHLYAKKAERLFIILILFGCLLSSCQHSPATSGVEEASNKTVDNMNIDNIPNGITEEVTNNTQGIQDTSNTMPNTKPFEITRDGQTLVFTLFNKAGFYDLSDAFDTAVEEGFQTFHVIFKNNLAMEELELIRLFEENDDESLNIRIIFEGSDAQPVEIRNVYFEINAGQVMFKNLVFADTELTQPLLRAYFSHSVTFQSVTIARQTVSSAQAPGRRQNNQQTSPLILLAADHTAKNAKISVLNTSFIQNHADMLFYIDTDVPVSSLEWQQVNVLGNETSYGFSLNAANVQLQNVFIDENNCSVGIFHFSTGKPKILIKDSFFNETHLIKFHHPQGDRNTALKTKIKAQNLQVTSQTPVDSKLFEGSGIKKIDQIPETPSVIQ